MSWYCNFIHVVFVGVCSDDVEAEMDARESLDAAEKDLFNKRFDFPTTITEDMIRASALIFDFVESARHSCVLLLLCLPCRRRRVMQLRRRCWLPRLVASPLLALLSSRSPRWISCCKPSCRDCLVHTSHTVCVSIALALTCAGVWVCCESLCAVVCSPW